MACALSPASSPATNDGKNVRDSLRRCCSSNGLLGKTVLLQRSYSENHLCYSVGRISMSMAEPKLKNSRSGFFNIHLSSATIPGTIKSLLFHPETGKDMEMEEEDDHGDKIRIDDKGKKRGNWVETLVELRRKWREKQEKEEESVDDHEGRESACDGGCEVEYEDDVEGNEISIDNDMFASMLRSVSRSDTKIFSRFSFLCNLAYVIEDIKTEDLKRYYGLDFVTSSLEKKAEAAALEGRIEQDSTRVPVVASTEIRDDPISEPCLPSSAAYDIAVSAASYVQYHTKELLTTGCEPKMAEEDVFLPREDGHHVEEEESPSAQIYKSERAACVAASTMTTVVAAGSKEKEKAAKDLQSLHSSPCEWFVCDDPSIYTRCFVIQGSDSLASWQANLFFEPTKFEGMDVLVHRGIYEAAKGIYEQFLPEIKQHLNRYGDRAKFQFTGHSLGGSLATLVGLMILIRKVIKTPALLPVVSFGSPFVFCGGQKILDELNLDENHVQCVMMHRDIVPRAFSCNYPNYVAQVLKRLTKTFQFHPCLNKNRLLYSPMGKIFILQPDEKSSPPHSLLPPGSALYALDNGNSSQITSALRAFLNSPHPLETLSDPTAYGSEGTIIRDHDSSNYLKALNEVVRQQTRLLIKKTSPQRNQLWPLLTARSPHSWSHTNNNGARSEVVEKILTGV